MIEIWAVIYLIIHRVVITILCGQPLVPYAANKSSDYVCAAAAGSSVGCVSAVTGANGSGKSFIDSDCARRSDLDSRMQSSSLSSVMQREESVMSMDRKELEVIEMPRCRQFEDPLQRDSIVYNPQIRNPYQGSPLKQVGQTRTGEQKCGIG